MPPSEGSTTVDPTATPGWSALLPRTLVGVADPGVGPRERRSSPLLHGPAAGWRARWPTSTAGRGAYAAGGAAARRRDRRTTTSKPFTSPRATRFSTSSRSWVSGSKSLPPAEPSRSRAVAVSVRASATDASTRLFTRPSVIWRITMNPTEPTTSGAEHHDGRDHAGAQRPPPQGQHAARPGTQQCPEPVQPVSLACGLIRAARLVAHAAHGHHDRGVLRIDLDLRPQPLDVHVDQPGVGGVAVAPDLLEQHLAGEHLARVLRQAHQQVELERGQPDRRPARVTSWPVTSMVRSPMCRSSGVGTSKRRTRARMRATSSLGLNGLAT